MTEPKSPKRKRAAVYVTATGEHWKSTVVGEPGEDGKCLVVSAHKGIHVLEVREAAHPTPGHWTALPEPN